MAHDSEVVIVKGNQPAQSNFLKDRGPGWTLYQGGLGSGKTWAAARKFLWFHARNKCLSLASAPTYGDIWRFVVPELVKVCDELRWPYKITRNVVPTFRVLKNDILLISGEHPERFSGFEVGTVWVDEGARMQSSIEDPLRDSPLQIRGRLRNKEAKTLHGIVSSTPEGTDTWLQRDWFDKPLAGHRAYIGETARNDALPAEYVQNMKANLPAELVDQYLRGIAVSYTAHRAHPTFSRERNVCEFDWIPGLPLHIGCDYNVSPMCWVAAQVVGDEVRFIDEVIMEDFGQVDSAVQMAHAKGWGKYFVNWHSDKSAKARSTVGDPEFTVMTQSARNLGWNFTGDAYGANPPVQGRINNMSRMILDATGKSRLKIHPRCNWFINDLERTGRGSNGYDPGELGKRGHSLDAAGYLCWDVARPMGLPSASSILN